MNLYKTAAIVTVFAAFEHGLGFLYRIILSRILGPEGLGVYQVALSVFAVFLTVASSGLPITLSRVISKHRAHGYDAGRHRATTAAILIALTLSLALSFGLFVLRKYFTGVFSDPRCADLFYILLFGLPFTSVYAVIRGSFWGNKRFFAYSLIELIEEIVMIVVGVGLLLYVKTVPGVNLAAAAVVVSYLASFAIAAVYFTLKGGRLRAPKGELKPLLKAAIPVTVMRTCSSLTGSLISVVFPMRLMAAGMSSARAMSAYGVVGGMVMPILTIPCSLISSIALVLVPELSECYYRGDKEKLSALTTKALCSALLIAGALIPFFSVCGEGLGVFLYSNAESGVLIERSALMLIPMSVTMISTSILNSMGCEKQTLLFFLLGAGAMLLSAWFLPAYFHGGALLVGMALDYAVSAACSLVLLVKKTGKLACGKYLLKLAAVVFALSIAGMGMRFLLMRYLDYLLAHAILILVLGGGELFLFRLLRLFDPKVFLSRFFKPKKRHKKRERTDGKNSADTKARPFPLPVFRARSAPASSRNPSGRETTR